MTSRAPFRADQVGSLLRPDRLKTARADFESGITDADTLRSIEDQCISEVVARQEAAGLQAVTDGEFRRAWWHFDYLDGLEGVALVKSEHGIQFQGVQTKPGTIAVTGRVGFDGHYMLDHFRFLHGITNVTPKMTIPAPSVLHFRGGRVSISKQVYPGLDEFFADTPPRLTARQCRRFMPPAAGTCNSMTRYGPIYVPQKSVRPRATGAMIRNRCRASMPT